MLPTIPAPMTTTSLALVLIAALCRNMGFARVHLSLPLPCNHPFELVQRAGIAGDRELVGCQRLLPGDPTVDEEQESRGLAANRPAFRNFVCRRHVKAVAVHPDDETGSHGAERGQTRTRLARPVSPQVGSTCPATWEPCRGGNRCWLDSAKVPVPRALRMSQSWMASSCIRSST